MGRRRLKKVDDKPTSNAGEGWHARRERRPVDPESGFPSTEPRLIEQFEREAGLERLEP